MTLASTSKHRIDPEKVNKDNSNLWRYSTILFSALRKENFSKADPEAFIDYCDAIGILGGYDPEEDENLRMDLEKFKGTLNEEDANIFSLFLMGLKQREIEEMLEIKQRYISGRLAAIFKKFERFYFKDDRGIVWMR